MADWLDKAWRPEIRARLCNIIEATPWLDWLLLSKRIGNAPKIVPEHWRAIWPPNAWAGASIVNQDEADRDIPKLQAVPARIRFLSCEPLLGPIWREHWRGIDWVILGGESGPSAREYDLAWDAQITGQCFVERVPIFRKQLGARPVSDGKRIVLKDAKGGDWREWPEHMRVREFPA